MDKKERMIGARNLLKLMYSEVLENAKSPENGMREAVRYDFALSIIATYQDRINKTLANKYVGDEE